MASKKKKEIPSVFEILDKKRNEEIAQMSKGSKSTQKFLNQTLAPSSRSQIASGIIKTSNPTTMSYGNQEGYVAQRILAPLPSTPTTSTDLFNKLKTENEEKLKQQNQNKKTDWIDSLKDGYNFGDITKTVLGTVGFGEHSRNDKPIEVDTKAIENMYKNYTEEQLIKEQKNIQNKILTYSKNGAKSPKNKDGKYTLSGVLSMASNENNEKLRNDPEYITLNQIDDVLTEMIQNTRIKNKKYDKGFAGFAEKSNDVLVGGMAKGARGIEGTVKKIIGKEDTISEKTFSEKYSEKAISQANGKVEKAALEMQSSIGQMIPQMVVPAGKASTVVGFANYGGSAYNEAKEQGYTEEQATRYGIVNGTLEMALNKVLPSFKVGGKNIYGKTATDNLMKKIMTKTLGNEAFKRWIIDASGEFTEEYLQEFLDPIVREALLEENNGVGIIKGKNASEIASNIANYTAKNFFSKENFHAGLLGALNSGLMGAPSAFQANAYTKATGRSAETGLTQNEQKVVDSIVENRKAELKEKNGKVTKKDISKIEQEVRQDLERGYIETNDIERALSNEEWTKHDNVVKQKESLQKELDELNSRTMDKITPPEYKRISELEEQIKNIDTDTTRNELNSAMNGKVTDNDTLLQRTYGEEIEKKNKYQFDKNEKLTEQTKKINEDIEKLGLNNNIKTRDTVDLIKKLSNETGRQYRLIDNNSTEMEKVEGKNVDGFVRNGEVFINVDSENLINRILGHETTHLFEGTEDYTKLQNIAKEYAKTKGEYDSRKSSLEEVYKDIKDANIENELTSDLVGDYLFSDIEFVRNLNREQPNMFQKIYNHIKHLYNMATAGSKEARQLEQLKYNFEKVYRENNQSKASNNTKLMASKIEQHIDKNANLEYNKNGIYIEDESEYGSLQDTVKYLQSQKLLKKRGIDFVENGKYWYGIKSKSFGDFKAFLRIEISGNETLIDNIKGEYKNGTYKNSKTVDSIIESIKNDRESSDRDNADITKRESTRQDDRLYNREQRQFDKRKNTDENGNINRELDSSFKIPTKDSQGRKLTKTQQLYFRNSKVRDSKGNLEIVYHQTNADFTEFKNGFSKRGFKNANFFTNQKPNKVLKNLMEGYVAINKPLYLENVSINQGIVDKAIQDGYDGIINQNIQGIEGKKEIITFKSKQFKNIDNTNPSSSPDIRFSISVKEANTGTDNNGVKLSKEQQEYFKDSKATDENGNLITVYHTTTNAVPQFNEFNPVGTDYYRFGDQVVNYYTNSKDMSGSYASQDYIMADTKKITSMEEVQEYIKNKNELGWGSDKTYELIQDDGKYKLIDNSKVPNTNKTWKQVYNEANKYKSTLTEKELSQFNDMFDKSSDYNSDGRYNIDSYLMNNNYKFGSEEDVIAQKYLNIDNKNVYERGIYFDALFRNAKYHSIAEFNNKQDLFRNIKSKGSTLAKIQYEGYVNITNPYVIDAEERNWNQVVQQSNEFIDELEERVPQDIKDNLTRLYQESANKSAEARENYDVLEKVLREGIDGYYSDVDENVKKVNNVIRGVGFKEINQMLKGEPPGVNAWYNVADYLEREGLIGSATKNFIIDEFRLPEQVKTLLEESYTKKIPIQQIQTFDAAKLFKQIGNETTLKELYEKNYQNYEQFDKYRMPNSYFLEKISSDSSEPGHVDMGYELNDIFETRAEIYSPEQVGEEIAQASSVAFSKPEMIRLWGTSKTTNDVVKEIIASNKDGKTNYDGVIIKNVYDYGGKSATGTQANDLYITFNSNQFKAADNTTPTDDPDIRYRLSSRNDIAPITDNRNIRARDMLLPRQQETQQEVEKIVAPIQEENKALKQEVETLKKEVKDIRENSAVTQEEFEQENRRIAPLLEEQEAPPEVERAYDNLKDTTRMPKKELKMLSKNIKDALGLTNRQKLDLEEIIQNYSISETATREDLYNDIKKRYGKQAIITEYEDIRNVQTKVKSMKLDVSDNIKHSIADYNKLKQKNFGKLNFSRNGQPVDVVYQELNAEYPNYFPDNIYNETDQFQKIVEVANLENKSIEEYDIDDNYVRETSDYIYDSIMDSKQDALQKAIEKTTKESLQGDLKAPLPTVFDTSSIEADNAYDEVRLMEHKARKKQKVNKTSNVSRDSGLAPYIEFAREHNLTGNDEVIETLNEADAAEENKRIEAQKKIKPQSENSIRKALTYGQYLFTNRNVEIDNYAEETGNHNIKLLADHINNIQGEISTNINDAQTDNFGKTIGKSITQIFSQADKAGLSEPFNDYLFHLSNIERHKWGKGSQVPMADSLVLTEKYEKAYPEMKSWAKEVNKYNKNLLYKQADAGLITKELADNLSDRYEFYVPFMENLEGEYTPDSSNTIKTRSTVKRAKGGADRNLLGFEEAMINQTSSAISQIRKNQLYQEIVKTVDNATIDFDTNTNPDINNSGLMSDGKKYYLTAYVDGKATQVEIDKSLYHGLAQEGNRRIRNAEQKLAPLTNPLQKASNIRRNILTTWSPSFLATNMLKDIQDAPLNSKYASDMIKNYPKALKEIATGKGEHVEAFLNMYGQGNLRGDYNLDSGLADATELVKSSSKNKGIEISKSVLKKIPQMNEVIELAPRYAEYLASLENGCSQMEALYNAREVTTNFGRGGIITKALNRNGFTFLNANVQGMSRLVRNFSGANGARGVVNSLTKVAALGIAPALFNALMYGSGDDEDKDYKALPDYIKDNYYLIKTSNNNFIRIPKGRMLSIFGSAARRTLELSQGEKDAFNGYISNAYNQVGVQNPIESNIFAPLIQAKNNKTWYGSDLVPSRLQDKPKDEQYDSSTDKFSIWLGQKTKISPYKINYVIDQYSGGIGDMILPTITEEAQSDTNSTLGTMIAPLKDKFTADSTTDNKYVSDFYTKNDEFKVKANSSKATDKDKLTNQYMKTISFEMGQLYGEMRKVQEDKKLSKSEKYRKAQNIKKEINKLAEEGLNGYNKVSKVGDYAEVGEREFYKWTNDEGETVWSKPKDEDLDKLNSLGLTIGEKSEYYKTRSKLFDVWDKHKDNYDKSKSEAIKAIRKSNMSDDAKYALYNASYNKDEEMNIAQEVGIEADAFLDYMAQTFKADKNRYGKSISGSKKAKILNYINSMNIEPEQRMILYKMQYKTNNYYNNAIVNYLNNSSLTYEEEEYILKKLGFKVSKNGNISW